MMSALEGGGTWKSGILYLKSVLNADKGEGVKKYEKSSDAIYGSSLASYRVRRVVMDKILLILKSVVPTRLLRSSTNSWNNKCNIKQNLVHNHTLHPVFLSTVCLLSPIKEKVYIQKNCHDRCRLFYTN